MKAKRAEQTSATVNGELGSSFDMTRMTFPGRFANAIVSASLRPLLAPSCNAGADPRRQLQWIAAFVAPRFFTVRSPWALQSCSASEACTGAPRFGRGCVSQPAASNQGSRSSPPNVLTRKSTNTRVRAGTCLRVGMPA